MSKVDRIGTANGYVIGTGETIEDMAEARAIGTRAQAQATRVLHRYADPGTRREAELSATLYRVRQQERERRMVLAEIDFERGEVLYHCTGCGTVIEPARAPWHRMHGRVTEISK